MNLIRLFVYHSEFIFKTGLIPIGLVTAAVYLVAQTVKSLPAMRETWARSLSPEESLEKEMATHSNTLACKIAWTEKPGGLQSMGSQRVGHD